MKMNKLPIVNRKSAGMALVISLILLSIITFLTVVFLVITQRERGSVATTTDSTTARFAAASALERATAQLVANMMALTNDQAYDLLVSTNFINRDGFFTGVENPTNANYDFLNGGGALNADQMQLAIHNLEYDPRVPVFRTNPVAHVIENQYYLDLNRNGLPEANGLWPIFTGDPSFPFINATNGAWVSSSFGVPVVSNNFVGDPEWIGVLEHPDQPHSRTNRFVARYAFIAIPASKTLDINYIHNYAKQNLSLVMAPTAGDGFQRNQGVGSWEINLAAFLADLNTNEWNPTSFPYNYRLDPLLPNIGVAFDDALSLLRYRYANYTMLATVQNLYGNNGAAAIEMDNIDEYADGPLQVTTAVTNDNDIATVHWSGADNTNHFFTTQDLFDPNKSSTGFTNRLLEPGMFNGSYDRYTYYRLLSQLGTDSAAESGKININYINVDDVGNIVPPSTNLVQWTNALQFFTNAADRVLRAYTAEWFKSDPTNFLATFYGVPPVNYYYSDSPDILTNAPTGLGLTNIPFWGMTNQVPSFGLANIPAFVNTKPVYSAAIHRLLQITANIWDATTNRFVGQIPAYPYFPSVFRPVYWHTNYAFPRLGFVTNVVFVSGFLEENDTSGLNLPNVAFGELSFSGTYSNVNIYGMPWVIGAKKGFPNFNQLSSKLGIQVTRKLRMSRSAPNNDVSKTEWMWLVGISNITVASAWNSYTNSDFPRRLEMRLTNDFSYNISHDADGNISLRPTGWQADFGFGTDNSNPYERAIWPRYPVKGMAASVGSQKNSAATFYRENILLTNATYVVSPAIKFVPSTNTQFVSSGFADDPMPQWYVITTNRFRFALIDKSVTPNRVVDYVNLDMSTNILDLTAAILDYAKPNCPPRENFQTPGPGTSPVIPGVQSTDDDNINRGVWCVDARARQYGNVVTDGVHLQIYVSENGPSVSDNVWKEAYDGSKKDQSDGFRAFLGTPNDTLTNDAPYSPTFYFSTNISWKANDPLVHYTLEDLRTMPAPTDDDWPTLTNTPILNLKPVIRYRPWAFNKDGDDDDNRITKKDPLVTGSDAWDFPTNKFPNVGWLGRVHRGTPWQTVYLKSDTNITDWTSWSGHPDNVGEFTRPFWDRLLFDVFTTAINDNAAHGQLSVNTSTINSAPLTSTSPDTSGLAAWSAVLSGAIVLTNNESGEVGPFVIQPAAISPEVFEIVTNINAVRVNTNLTIGGTFPNRAFQHVGDVLAAPLLTEKSPFLNIANLANNDAGGISDEVMERIPQQIMSLLTLSHTPRFVIYAYGQALRPADRSVVMNGDFFGLCTNYQITAETAMRAVVHIENAPQPGVTNGNPHVVVDSFNILPTD